MLFNLILKDLKAYKKYLSLAIFLPGILWTSIVFYKYFPWNNYMMFCNLIIFAAGAYYTFSEKRQNLQTLICSLPVSRNQIVIAKYLTTIVIVVIGIIIFILTTYFNNQIHGYSAIDFQKVFHLKILFMSFFMFSIFFSIFLPATFYFSLIGMAFTLAIASIISVHSFVIAFRAYKSSFVPYFPPDEVWKILLLTMIMICLPTIYLPFIIKSRIWSKKHLFSA